MIARNDDDEYTEPVRITWTPGTYGDRLRMRTKRLAQFAQHQAPVHVMRTELRMIQEAVDQVAQHGGDTVIT